MKMTKPVRAEPLVVPWLWLSTSVFVVVPSLLIELVLDLGWWVHLKLMVVLRGGCVVLKMMQFLSLFALDFSRHLKFHP